MEGSKPFLSAYTVATRKDEELVRGSSFAEVLVEGQGLESAHELASLASSAFRTCDPPKSDVFRRAGITDGLDTGPRTDPIEAPASSSSDASLAAGIEACAGRLTIGTAQQRAPGAEVLHSEQVFKLREQGRIAIAREEVVEDADVQLLHASLEDTKAGVVPRRRKAVLLPTNGTREGVQPNLGRRQITGHRVASACPRDKWDTADHMAIHGVMPKGKRGRILIKRRGDRRRREPKPRSEARNRSMVNKTTDGQLC